MSPTFTLVREYEGRLPFRHLDVYRLDHVQEAIDLGLEEMLDDGVVVIEWGEGVRELLPARPRSRSRSRCSRPTRPTTTRAGSSSTPVGAGWVGAARRRWPRRSARRPGRRRADPGDRHRDRAGRCRVGRDGRVLGEVRIDGGRRHAEELAPAIEYLRGQTGIALDELACVAVGVGPGLFTGLRVGVTTARTLAQVLDVPVVGIPSLDLVAYPWRATHRRVVALDRRPPQGGVRGAVLAGAGRRAARRRVHRGGARGGRGRAARDRHGVAARRRRRARVRRRSSPGSTTSSSAGPAAAAPSVGALVELATRAVRARGVLPGRRGRCRSTCAGATPRSRGTPMTRERAVADAPDRSRSSPAAQEAPARGDGDRAAGVHPPVDALAVPVGARAAGVARVPRGARRPRRRRLRRADARARRGARHHHRGRPAVAAPARRHAPDGRATREAIERNYTRDDARGPRRARAARRRCTGGSASCPRARARATTSGPAEDAVVMWVRGIDTPEHAALLDALERQADDGAHA